MEKEWGAGGSAKARPLSCTQHSCHLPFQVQLLAEMEGGVGGSGQQSGVRLSRKDLGSCWGGRPVLGVSTAQRVQKMMR